MSVVHVTKNSTTSSYSAANLLKSNKVSPNGSVTGDGGSASLTWMASNKTFSWSAKPTTDWPYSFDGDIEVYDLNENLVDDIPVTGYGALGSTVSGIANPDVGSGTWIAKFSGEAYAMDGSEYVVLPGCEISFGI